MREFSDDRKERTTCSSEVDAVLAVDADGLNRSRMVPNGLLSVFVATICKLLLELE